MGVLNSCTAPTLSSVQSKARCDLEHGKNLWVMAWKTGGSAKEARELRQARCDCDGCSAARLGAAKKRVVSS